LGAYQVGIDLGTTHTVVAFAPSDASTETAVLPLPQLVSAHEVESLALLPSFLYAPLCSEDCADPWQELPWLVGEHARRRGAEVTERLVASAKSWLSHSGVSRRDAILPWGADDAGTPKISPIQASQRLLSHVRRCWDDRFPADPLREQQVVLTVPASFDEVARELTVEAAELAGLTIKLLEEPQAAFYDLLASEREAVEALLDQQRASASILVCDVGGGTTDLTLIEARRSARGELELDRVAVGRHLLLGGDNIDLALAHLCEQRLIIGERLDAVRFSRLLLACRTAKEALLGDHAPDSMPIRVSGLGSALVGSTLATELQRSEVDALVFDGFLPLLDRSAARPKPRAGLVAFGLPYERDPAISRHVVQFLERHAPGGVDALLLNGGLFHARRAAQRVREVVASFGQREVVLLPFRAPDLAVARGAVAYAHSLSGHGVRIGGGSARGFYVSVDERKARRALCVVPKGAREGERHTARAGELWLRVGAPVKLELYTSDAAMHRAGDIVSLSHDFISLPAVTTAFGDTASAGSQPAELEVALQGELSAIGTVELSCVEVAAAPGATPRRFRLTFDLRESSTEARAAPSQELSAPSRLPPRLPEALEAIHRVFGDGRVDVHARESKDLPRELERLLGERRQWTLETNRALFDALAEGRAARRRSEEHERVFWMLAGYCLRPGFGALLDERRIAQLVPLFDTGLPSTAAPRSWQQFWIAWRRIVAGLREDTQTRLLGLLEPFWAPSELKLKRSKSLKPAEASFEILELMASLERVPAERRRRLGDWIVERTFFDHEPRLWSALGRIGARVPGYASVHHVVPPSAAENWLKHLLSERWNELPTAASTASQLARITNDRARDISPATRAEIVRRLEVANAAPDLIAPVRDFVPVVELERAAWFGEDLPLGLRLAAADDAAD
jgi:molecular chaperone DnaK (HSP70)